MYKIEMNHGIESLFQVNSICLTEPMSHMLCLMMVNFLVLIEIMAPLSS